MSRANYDELLSAASRDLLKEKLSALLPIAEVLEANDLLEVAQTLIAILSAPEPVRAKSVMPMMASLDRRVAELFGRGVEETTGPLRASMQQGKAQAEKSEAWYRAELAEDDPKPD